MARTEGLVLVLAVLAVAVSAVNSSSDGSTYQLELSKTGLAAGRHTYALVTPGSKAADIEAALKAEVPEGQRSPKLGPLDQEHYYPLMEVSIKDSTGILIVDAVSIRFEHPATVANFVIPPFKLRMFEAGSQTADFVPESMWRVAANATVVDIPIPAGDDGTLHVSDLPPQLTVILTTEKMLVSSYAYEFTKVPEELLSGRMYDLRPGNASMLFKFLAKYDDDSDTLGVWVSRRAPIPDFTFVLGLDGKLVGSFSASAVPPGGLGVKEAFKNIEEKKDSTFTLVAHFYESFPYKAPVSLQLSDSDHEAILSALRSEGGEGPFVDQAQFQLASSSPKTSFIFKYFNDTKHVAVQFAHSHPMKAVMLTTYDGAGNVIFREVERIIPFSHDPFGWYYVLPTLLRETEKDEPQVSDQRIRMLRRLELHLEERSEMHPAELMTLWLKDTGANVDDIRVADNIQRAFDQRTHTNQEILRLRGLAANREFKKDDIVASVPYRALLTSRVLETNEWCRLILQNASAEYKQLAAVNGFQSHGIHFMLMAFFAVVQPHHPVEGTNWRLYFDTWPKDPPPLPLFYSSSELHYFGFNPSIERDSKKMRSMWTQEYDLLTRYIPWMKKVTPLSRYMRLRAQVESRVVNASGTLIMIPLMDFMNHADDSSIRLSYNDQQQKMLFLAEGRIPIDGPITTNYGSKSMSKRDFLVQFGFVPPGALDSVEMNYGDKPYHLLMSTESARPLQAAIQEKLLGTAAEEGDDEADPEVGPKVRKMLRDLLQERLNGLPTEIPRPKASQLHSEEGRGVGHLLSAGHKRDGGLELWAQRLLNSEREVLQHHLTYLASTGSNE